MKMTDSHGVTEMPTSHGTAIARGLYIIGGDDKCVAGYLRPIVEGSLGPGMAPGIPSYVLSRTDNIRFNLPHTPDGTHIYAVADSITDTALTNFLGAISTLRVDGLVCIILADEAAGAEAETICREWSRTHSVPLAILRCAMVIGNGMEGRAKALADAIATGSYWHISGADAPCSAVCAVDVAALAAAIAGRSATLCVTDGHEHSTARLIDAMAVRLNNKRVLTLAPAAAKWLDRLSPILPWWRRLKTRRLTPRTLTTSGDSPAEVVPGFTARNVIDYLRS
ncbi:MAG: hypothetical protein NC187_01050 [Candidatus Amulumruptor caecigallinarius]|nr:hypothetical protein [Candidatus Amulumruptor caecigallinarius]MCM1396063.1 hypothetical protein [Candidatus Amulumruptor caecigallinarius]MCM1453062.1 hypothetical protein [bacterium]